jgi:DNA processing protein
MPDFPIADAHDLDGLCKEGMPRVLMADGDRLDALEQPRIAIVGTRAATPHGLADAREVGAFCARTGLTVVSGLAIGIDAAAHEGALDAGGLTIGVVATGLDVVYPRRHTRLYERVRERGLVMTENPSGTHPNEWRFPVRNRIIAGLARAVVVVEAKEKGGTSSTVKYAQLFDREIHAIPGSRRNPVAAGCNRLIADGAKVLLDPADVLGSFGATAPEVGWTKAPAARNPNERRVLRALGGEPATVDELEVCTRLSPSQLGTALRALETRGAVERRRGLWWPR